MKKLFLLLMTVILAGACAMAQTRTVTGTVVDAADEPLAGATVMPVGGGHGGSTDIDGNFSLRVPQNCRQLRVSYVGMVTQTVNITAGEMLIKLENSDTKLDEVMVVAYGTAKKSAYTGSASVVKADQIENRLVTDVTSALSGTTAGVQVQSANGQPGSSPKILIRGVGSINAVETPLYIIDGVPLEGDVAAVNPQDVESMTVLKDAAAAALYGARGANGVILITTKRGKEGEAKISLDARWGANSRQIKNYDVVRNPAQYMEMAYSALYNGRYYHNDYTSAQANAYANNSLLNTNSKDNYLGYIVYTVPYGQRLIGMNGKLNPNATLGYSDGTYFYTPDNWEEGTFANRLRQEYNLAISGANERLNYYLSVGYLDDGGTISNSDYERLSTRASVEYKARKWLQINTNLNYTHVSTNSPSGQTTSNSSANAFGVANMMAPIYPMYVRNADGSFRTDPATGNKIYDYGNNTYHECTNFTRAFMNGSNPAGDLIYDKSQYLMDIFNGQWGVVITPLEGLTITGNANVFVDNTRVHLVHSRSYGQYFNYKGAIQQITTRTRSLNYQGLINYVKTFGDLHHTNFLLGYESYGYNYEELSGYGRNIYDPDDFTMSNVIDNKDVSGSVTQYATRGFFLRANYDFDSRYFFSGSYRRDASSRFAPDKRWGNFFSVSAAWEIAKESWAMDWEAVDMLKLKASYGQQGNDNIGNNYAYLDQFNKTGADGVWTDGVLVYKGNPDLTWETSNAFNVGVDFSFWKGKLDGTLEWFSRQTSDMLYSRPVAPSNGYTSIPMNVGSMRNMGVELEINYRPIDTRDITWELNGNLTYIQNKVISLAPELEGEWISGSRIFHEGESMYQYYLTPYAGVDAATGQALYWAKNDAGQEYATPDYNRAYDTNRKATGNMMPPVYGGFGTTLRAYGVDFAIQFAYQAGGKMMDSGYQNFMTVGTTTDAGYNWHKDALNAWTPQNVNTDVPRLDAQADYSAMSSDRWLISSNYLSLNNITLGYTFPEKWTRKMGLESLRVYGSADNVALWSARKGLDPRQSYLSSSTLIYTTARSISGGLKVVF